MNNMVPLNLSEENMYVSAECNQCKLSCQLMFIRSSEGISPYIYMDRQPSSSSGKEGHFSDNSLIKYWQYAVAVNTSFGALFNSVCLE